MNKLKRKRFSISPWQKLLSISALLSLSLLSSCGGLSTSVKVPNAHFTYLSEASADVYAVQFQFLVKGTHDIPLSTWVKESKGQICMPLPDWTAFNVMISDFCSAKHINCDYAIESTGQSPRQMFNTLFRNMQKATKKPFRKILPRD